jgi:hypothetical protein
MFPRVISLGMSGAGLGELVIFGGSEGTATIGETWEYE